VDYAAMIASGGKDFQALTSVVPVVPTNAATAYSSGTVSGPVLANLGAFLTMRRTHGVRVQILRERYAEFLQTAVNVYLRADFAVTGRTSAAVFSK
jgi:hypothetical protein